MQESEANLGVLLFIPYRYLETRIFQAVREAGFDDVTPAQARLFQRIDPAGSRLTDLASQAQLTKQSAAELVGELDRLGYVDRVPDPADGRARLIRIADRGRRAIAVAQAEHDRVIAEWRRQLGDRRMNELRGSLDRLRQITDPYRSGPN